MSCAVVDDASGELSTDGNATDAGRLDARHGVALGRSERAHGRGGVAALGGLHTTVLSGHSRAARTKYTVRSGHGV